MPTIRLDENAQHLLNSYRWNGNVRQLRNIAEQLSVLEEQREISGQLLKYYYLILVQIYLLWLKNLKVLTIFQMKEKFFTKYYLT